MSGLIRQLERREAFLFGIVGLVILAGVVLRVVALDEQGYWNDEIYSVAHLSGFDAYVLPSSDLRSFEPPQRADEWIREMRKDRFSSTLDRNLIHEGHPPLYQLGLKAWTTTFGRSVEAVRAFSLLPALLLIPLLYWVGRVYRNPAVGAVAAALAAASPFHLYFSVEARNYSWAIFFSGLALLASIRLWRDDPPISRRWLVVWTVAVLGALYTHYYAGLYCAVLGVLIVFSQSWDRRSSAKLSIPFVLFLPWLPALQMQLQAHSEHWTSGAPELVEAGVAFLGALLDHLTGVRGSATSPERVLAGIALAAALLLLLRQLVRDRSSMVSRNLLVSIPAFGLLVVAVDFATGHHTILVSRYLSGLLPSLLVVVASTVAFDWRPARILPVLLIAVNLFGAAKTAQGQRAPKQMLRGAGAFIGQHYSRGDLVLATPSGPLLLGLSMYLPSHARVAASRPNETEPIARAWADSSRTVWLVRQNLGAPGELSDQQLPVVDSDSLVRFVGVDVLPVRSNHQP